MDFPESQGWGLLLDIDSFFWIWACCENRGFFFCELYSLVVVLPQCIDPTSIPWKASDNGNERINPTDASELNEIFLVIVAVVVKIQRSLQPVILVQSQTDVWKKRKWWGTSFFVGRSLLHRATCRTIFSPSGRKKHYQLKSRAGALAVVAGGRKEQIILMRLWLKTFQQSFLKTRIWQDQPGRWFFFHRNFASSTSGTQICSTRRGILTFLILHCIDQQQDTPKNYSNHATRISKNFDCP